MSIYYIYILNIVEFYGDSAEFRLYVVRRPALRSKFVGLGDIGSRDCLVSR